MKTSLLAIPNTSNWCVSQQLKAIASSASNTWGLLLLVGLLGYSLVEVPRGLWRSTTPRHRLSMAYFKAAKISADKCHAEEALDDVLDVSINNLYSINIMIYEVVRDKLMN
jgi:hypothetical protein